MDPLVRIVCTGNLENYKNDTVVNPFERVDIFCATVGAVNEDMIRKYVESQSEERSELFFILK